MARETGGGGSNAKERKIKSSGWNERSSSSSRRRDDSMDNRIRIRSMSREGVHRMQCHKEPI